MPDNAISLANAIKFTKSLRLNRELMLAVPYQDRNILPICESFPGGAIRHILDQAGCEGIRVYLGMDDNQQVRIIMVGYDENNNDILPVSQTTTDGEIVENGMRCPTYCPPPSVLNS